MATVSKRRGKWVADYRDGTGRRHWETYETRRAAEDALAQHVTALREGRYAPPNNKRTVREAFESWWSLGVEGYDNRGGIPLRLSTKEIYRLTWRVHVEPEWAARKLATIRTEEVAHWRQHMLSAGVGPRIVHNSLLMLSFLCKHARRFKWLPVNPCGEVRKPKFRVKVRAFTAAEVATLTSYADDATRVLIRTAAHTGLRIGELAGLEWSCVDLEKGEIHVEKQFTHEAWADLKTVNSRRRVPIAKELLKELTLHRARIPGLLVFPGPCGAPLRYHNWHSRVWAPLLKRSGVSGNFHMLRHFFVLAMLQAGVNVKVAQTLAGHHSAAFTLDVYADALPQQMDEAGEKVADVIIAASGSILVANSPTLH
jgi:integrase